MMYFAAALVGLWLLGLILEFTLGGAIHLVLAVALVIALRQIIRPQEEHAQMQPAL